MDTLDMSGVDPLRYEETRRRVGVVTDYLAIPSPTAEHLRTGAASLDLSVNQFKALVRAWRTNRSAAKIAASGAHRGGTRAPNRLAVAPKAKEIAAEAIGRLGPTATLSELSATISTCCTSQGLTPPSDSTIWLMVRAARQTRSSDEDGVVIGTCLVPLPVRANDGLAQPMLTIAVRACDKAIVAASLGEADWQTAALAIAATMEIGARVRVDDALLRQKRSASLRVGIEPMPGEKVRTIISRILGSGIDDLRLIYRPGRAVAASRLLTTKEDRPLSPQDARAIIEAAIARHNAGRGAREASWIDAVSPPSTS